LLCNAFSGHLYSYYKYNLKIADEDWRYVFNQKIADEDWRQLFSHLYRQVKTEDSIVIVANELVQYYNRGNYKTTWLSPSRYPFVKKDIEKKFDSIFFIFRGKPKFKTLQGYGLVMHYALGKIGFLQFKKIE
jgi:2-oxoglutarate dehydrogenase complex dehydrogenase (E1) component-like enzyme